MKRFRLILFYKETLQLTTQSILVKPHLTLPNRDSLGTQLLRVSNFFFHFVLSPSLSSDNISNSQPCQFCQSWLVWRGRQQTPFSSFTPRVIGAKLPSNSF